MNLSNLPDLSRTFYRKCEVLRDVVVAKPGHCACGCPLIRDAQFDEHGNATGKLTWLCVVCTNPHNDDAADYEGRVGD